MSTRAAFATGTVLSLAVAGAWSWSANLTIGPSPALHLSRNLQADYAQLAAAPTGNGIALFAAVAVIYALCFTVSGLRRIRREAAGARESGRAARDADAAGRTAGWR